VGDATGSLKSKLGKYFGNDTLLVSIQDSIKLQEMLEGEARIDDIVKIYSDVVVNQKKYDLVRILQRQEPELYKSFEVELLARMLTEFQRI